MSDRVDLQEFVGGFVAEAEELLGVANAALLDIEGGNATRSPRPKSVRELFRALHTIKGLAGMIGVEPIVSIAHAVEALVRIADKGSGALRPGAVEVCLRAVRAIAERVRAIAENREPAAAPADLLDSLAMTDVASDAPSTPPPLSPEWDSRLSGGERQQLFQALRNGKHAYALTFQPSEALSASGVTIATVRARVSALGELVKVAPRTLPAPARGVAFDLLVISESPPAELAEAASAAQANPIALPQEIAAPAQTAPAESSGEELDVTPLGRSLVRVELARLDDLQEQLSGLLVSRYRFERELAALAARGADVRKMREIADLQARQLRELRGAILRARLVRVADVLEPLGLLVRSLAKPGYKEVRLELDARDAELDKAVADRLLPAIIHLVRNAIDHAVETVDERAALGKPRVATLRVTSQELSGNLLELAISDDGRGIDRDAVAKRAGRPIPDDDALLDVLTTPGFSTRDVANETSGRGFGMDIVRRIAEDQLGGELAVETERGVGTTFRMRVPVTIAIVDVFSFACGPQAFVVPVADVEEIFELDPGQRVEPPAGVATAARATMVQRRGKAMSLVSLGALLAIDSGADARKAIVLRRNRDALAFAVDRMLGRQEVVVRPVDDPLVRVPGVAGATDLGDGRATLVLDLTELGTHARSARA